jgi:hypothetical protein
MTQRNPGSSWIENEARKDKMRLSERGGQVVAMAVIGFVVLFFYVHQASATGFFTSSFGPTEAFVFYGSLLAGLTGPMVRLATGRKNSSRPAEMLAALFWTGSSAWLLWVFPFDFTHLGDVLPPVDFIHYLASLITNDVSRALLALGIIGGMLSIAFNAVLYGRVGNMLRAEKLR